MKILKLKGTVISPIHIGTGEQLTPLEYVVVGDKFHRIKIDRIGEINPQLAERIMPLIDSGSMLQVRRMIADNFDERLSLWSATAEKAFKKIYHDRIDDINNQILVETNTRTGAPNRTPLIPGSSLKGSIRTAYLSTRLNELPKNIRDKIRNFQGAPRNDFPRAKWIEGMILNAAHNRAGIDISRDPFKNLAVEDVLCNPNCVEVCQVDNSIIDRNSGKLTALDVPILIEAIGGELSDPKFNNTFDLTIRIKNGNPIEDWKDLKHCLDNYYIDGIHREDSDEFFKFYFKQVLDYMYDITKNLNDKTSIIRVGRFVGNYFITIRYVVDKDDFAMTRTIYDFGVPLGWVKLELIEEVTV